jgi:hypothetical protein
MRARLTLALILIAGAARADPQAPCSGPDHTPERAGYPPCVAWYAQPGRTGKYAVGYVGGGCVGRTGEPRRPDEGIFGWDYDCGWRPGRVFLNWCHCGKSPAPGPYQPDGPHVPDVFSVHPLRHLAAEKRHCDADH